MTPSPVAVAGATGYVGSRLSRLLAEKGRPVRALSRSGSPPQEGPDALVEHRAVDVGDESAVRDALAGCSVAYYLVHAMGSGTDFQEKDRRQAAVFARAARQAGVARLVYLGGRGGGDGSDRLSDHLASRHEVGRVLAAEGPPVVELRAAVILGSGSASFEMLRHLTERPPVMVTPRWVRTRIQPIAEVDLLAHLERAAEAAPGVYEIGGPEVTTYLGMIQSYARVRGLRPRRVTLAPLGPALSVYWVDAVTPVDRKVAHPLIHGIANEVTVRRASPEFPTRGLSVAEAIGAALDSQAAAVPGRLLSFLPGSRNGISAMRSHARLGADAVEGARADLGMVGGDLRWYGLAWAWRLRLLLGRAGGERLALRRPERVERGAEVDWWTVEAKDGSSLVLGTQSWFCGEAWLGYRITGEDDPAGAQVQQVGALRPKGLPGLAYWLALWPIHQVVFRVMARRQARRARVLSQTRLSAQAW